MAQIRIQTPGRVCLYGDHQDYLGLPVIACAIDRYIYLEANPIGSPVLEIHLPDLDKQRTISLSDPLTVDLHDHLASGLKVLRDLGAEASQGYHITISGNLPINAGVSSSSAVMVAWMHFLNSAYLDRSVNGQELGQLAYRAEVLEHHSPGGNMDQLTIACGDLVFIDTQGHGKVQALRSPSIGLVLGVSGIPKSTLGTLGSNRQKAEQVISAVRHSKPDFVLRDCTPSEVDDYLGSIPAELEAVFRAAVGNHHLTLLATEELERKEPSLAKLGEIMTAHHALLRDNLGLSTERIEEMLSAARSTGALGGKIVGSGGGGCVICLCKPGNEDKIAEAMIMAGAKEAFGVKIANGSKLL